MPVLSTDPVPPHTLDPLELYASAIDTSDYVARVAPLVRHAVSDVGELLDVGAGGGQLGSALRDRQQPWTAIEPSPTMRRRLANLFAPPTIVDALWTMAEIGLKAHDTVLAATMPAMLETPQAFFAQCRAWARRSVVWVVPSQAGPRGLCFAGCLPAAWHGEDETPGIEIVLAGLPYALRPHQIAFADWTFSGVVDDLGRLGTYLADRLGWPVEDARRPQLADHLAAQAVPDAAGFRLNIPRKSAVLAWRMS
jgi:hypothetical protein